MEVRNILKNLFNSIGTKIIFPYVLLTLIVAGIGAFVVTDLVTGTLQERFDNQLLDSGRVVAEIMVDYEQARLSVLRAVVGTTGVSEGVENHQTNVLDSLVPQIIANSKTDAVVLVDKEGLEIYSWYKDKNATSRGADFSQLGEVRQVLDGYVDNSGNRRVMLAQTLDDTMLFTIGPIFNHGEQVGAVLIGTSIQKMVLTLTENAIARVSLYDLSGNVLGTSLTANQEDIDNILKETPQIYQNVATVAKNQVPTRSINILNQNYLLAYGDWRLRDQSFGMFSVALPSNFIINAAATSRNSLSLVFSLATVAVFAIGYTISRRIVLPLDKLVQTTASVTKGDLDQRSGINSEDEIGVLAKSFDNMTYTLQLRNQQLMEQASNLNAILQSIADGVIVLDGTHQIVKTNLAAQQIIKDVRQSSLSENQTALPDSSEDTAPQDWLTELTTSEQLQRYKIGNRVFSALPAPVITPTGSQSGTVLVLRDITREVEAEERQNSFITNVSHELRTPLTSVKGFTSLLLANGNDSLGAQNFQFTQVIDDNTDKLINHVNRLMEIAEIQSGTLQLNQELISFTKLTNKAFETWRAKMEAKEVLFELEFDNVDLWISGDEKRLAWSIDNLLQNAYTFTLEGGEVRVRITHENEMARLIVKDTGIGINATELPYIFDRFYRIENDITINTPGMGLGLFIVRFIVESHDGNVNVESYPDEGSTFSVSLPLEKQ